MRSRRRALIFGTITFFAAANAMGAEVPLASPESLGFAGSSVREMEIADMDGDGDPDIVFANGAISWLRNPTVGGGSWTSIPLPNTVSSAYEVVVGDFNGDGDEDILTLTEGDDDIRLFSNSGTGTNWSLSTAFTTPGFTFLMEGGNFNNDDLPDVALQNLDSVWQVRAYQNKLQVNGTIPLQFTGGANFEADWMETVDVDRDGFDDVLIAGAADDYVALRRNFGTTQSTVTFSSDPDGSGSQNGVFDGAFIALEGDVNADGLGDVIVGYGPSSNFVAAYLNPGTDTNVWTYQPIPFLANARTFAIGDYDMDGDDDIFTRFGTGLKWFENTRVLATWPSHDIPVSETHFPRFGSATDLDLDGDPDIVFYDQLTESIMWIENRMVHRGIRFSSLDSILSQNREVIDMDFADINRDGFDDIIVATSDDSTIRWYRNDGGVPPTYEEFTLATAVSGINSIAVGLLRSTSIPDVVASRGSLNGISWYENPGGANVTQTWTSRTVVSGDAVADFPVDVEIIDVNTDGFGDVVAGLLDDNVVGYYLNDGTPTSVSGGDWVRTTHTVSGPTSVSVGDVNGDNRDDFVATGGDGSVRLFRNTQDIPASFTSVLLATVNGARESAIADVDGDGDNDIIVVGSACVGSPIPTCTGRLEWFRNEGGATPSFTQIFIDTSLPYAALLAANDVDRDGDVDIFTNTASTTFLLSESLLCFVNDGGGTPSFSRQTVATTFGGTLGYRQAFFSDEDRNGFSDLLVSSISDDQIRRYTFSGGQQRAAFTPQAPSNAENGDLFSVFAIDVTHRGRAEDDDMRFEFTRFEVRDHEGALLPPEDIDLLFESFHLYRDNGDNTFSLSDILVSSFAGEAGFDGMLRLEIPQNSWPTIGAGETARFFLVIEIAEDAPAADHTRITLRNHNGIITARMFTYQYVFLSSEPGNTSSTSVISIWPDFVAAGDSDGDGFSDSAEDLFLGDKNNPAIHPILGDFTDDGTVTLTDAVSFYRYITDGQSNTLARLDVNGDRVVDISDAEALFDFVTSTSLLLPAVQ